MSRKGKRLWAYEFQGPFGSNEWVESSATEGERENWNPLWMAMGRWVACKHFVLKLMILTMQYTAVKIFSWLCPRVHCSIHRRSTEEQIDPPTWTSLFWYMDPPAWRTNFYTWILLPGILNTKHDICVYMAIQSMLLRTNSHDDSGCCVMRRLGIYGLPLIVFL